MLVARSHPIIGLAPLSENELAGHKWVCMEVEVLAGSRRRAAGSTSSIPNQVLLLLKVGALDDYNITENNSIKEDQRKLKK
ncbi:hypothetical protein PVK06_021752 [Gossypium arboreum]|uniref:Uncharacterized protein n=1 Tax=Gossypium arboreum TaxID=29729 RepID=A0ABR0PQU4_GOSAR|nr:hypothetical protein PVK06_021752 [Gossypium arboreum]